MEKINQSNLPDQKNYLIEKPLAKLQFIESDAEKNIVYNARVSNPTSQAKGLKDEKLIRYCLENGHWSILEQSNARFEITTSRAISAQIIRHSSMSFQEYSQRYAAVQSIQPIEIRLQDTKNRQNSIDEVPEEITKQAEEIYYKTIDQIVTAYQSLLDLGVAKEVARMIMPMSSTTRMYINGNIRSWVTYISVRAFGEGVQKEHRQIAISICEQLAENLPKISNALNWKEKIQLAKLKYNIK
jgi:thymidylate synthase (FAD)